MISSRQSFLFVLLSAVVLVAGNSTGFAQLEFEREPVNYSEARSSDPVARLQRLLDVHAAKLEFTEEHGWLPALLKQLDIPQSSQVLVSSKTSFQLSKISPRRPRALYFNDHTYVGWVQDGDVLEIMSTDPQLGGTFYTMSQEAGEPPRIVRDRGQCLICHASSKTQGVPGGVVRSVFMNAGGQPQYGSGTFTIDHRSPFGKRWGGYYVTGTHGKMRHMGNAISRSRQNPEEIDREAGANRKSLVDLLKTEPYLTPHSDIVALMVLEHQTQMHNYITLASYETRSAAHSDGIMNKALDRPADYTSETTQRRIKSAGDKLLRYLLFSGEFPLESPVTGTSGFAKEFSAQGPRDSHGRSLRDFDLKTRMFKYPCSYLIYAPSFDKLPAVVRNHVTKELHSILTGENTSEEFAHLTAADRKAILEILTETKPGLWDNP